MESGIWNTTNGRALSETPVATTGISRRTPASPDSLSLSDDRSVHGLAQPLFIKAAGMFGPRRIDCLSRGSSNRPYTEGPSVNLELELKSFLPTELLNYPRREDDNPLGVLSAAQASIKLLLEFQIHMQLPENAFVLLLDVHNRSS